MTTTDDLQPNIRPGRRGKIGWLRCENFEFTISGGIGRSGKQVKHTVILSVARTPDGVLHEVVIEGRGKIGQGKDLMLHDLSIAMSRIIQERDPETGEPLRD